LNEDVKAVVVQWFQQQPREFFVEGIRRLMHQLDACLSTHGYFFNSLYFFIQQYSNGFHLSSLHMLQ
jgi:hypothetical protein